MQIEICNTTKVCAMPKQIKANANFTHQKINNSKSTKEKMQVTANDNK